MMSLALVCSASAQSILEIAQEQVCWSTPGGADSSLTRYVLISTRVPDRPRTLCYVDENGQIADVSGGGSFTQGFCGCCAGGSGSGSDADWYFLTTDQTIFNPVWRSGRVAIGTMDTSHQLQLQGDWQFVPDIFGSRFDWQNTTDTTGTSWYGLLYTAPSGLGGSSNLSGGRNNLTLGTQSTVIDRTRLGVLAFAGNNPTDTDLKLSAFLDAVADGAWTGSNTASHIDVWVTAPGETFPRNTVTFQGDGRLELDRYFLFSDGVPTALLGYNFTTRDATRHPIAGTPSPGSTIVVDGTGTGLEWGTGGGVLIESYPFGFIYQKSTFPNTTDFAANGATVTTSSGKLRLSGGTSDFTKSVGLRDTTCIAQQDQRVTFVAPTKNGTSIGLAIGHRSTNSWFPASLAMGVDLSTGSNSGKAYISSVINGVPSNTYSTALLQWSAGDTIEIRYSKAETFAEVRAQNISTRDTSVIVRIFNTNSLTNTGVPSIWTLQSSDIDIVSYEVSTDSPVNADFALIGSSKTQGGVDPYAMSWAGGLAANYTVVNLGGGGDRTVEEKTRMAEVIRLKPKAAILLCGRNDIASGVPTLTWQANYLEMYNELVTAGIKVYVPLPIWETSTPIESIKTWVEATFPDSIIIDLYTPSYLLGTQGLSDGIHQNLLGHKVTYKTILNFLTDKGYVPAKGYAATNGIIGTGSLEDPFQIKTNTVSPGNVTVQTDQNGLKLTAPDGIVSRLPLVNVEINSLNNYLHLKRTRLYINDSTFLFKNTTNPFFEMRPSAYSSLLDSKAGTAYLYSSGPQASLELHGSANGGNNFSGVIFLYDLSQNTTKNYGWFISNDQRGVGENGYNIKKVGPGYSSFATVFLIDNNGGLNVGNYTASPWVSLSADTIMVGRKLLGNRSPKTDMTGAPWYTIQGSSDMTNGTLNRTIFQNKVIFTGANNPTPGSFYTANATVTVLGDCIISSTIWLNTAKTVGIFLGTGSPEGAITASIGSTFHRTDVAPAYYVKESGTGNTGWVAK